MATSPVIDIPRLLTPVSDEQPAGLDLRSSSEKSETDVLFSAVRDARKRAADAERRVRDFALLSQEDRQNEPRAPEPPDWDGLRRAAIEALGRSKDLWITAWLIEGLTRLHGFAGLRDGIRLAHQLCEQFWQDVHPRGDGDADLRTRFAQLAGLNGTDSEGTLTAAIMNVPITPQTSIRSLTCADYKDALELDRKDPNVRKRRVEQGAVTMQMLERAIGETPDEYLRNTFDDLQQAAEAYAGFNTFLAQKASKQNDSKKESWLPPWSRVRETLDECLRICRTLAGDRIHNKEAQVTNGEEVPGTPESSAPGASSPPVSTPAVVASIDTRQDALRTLLRVADYFRRPNRIRLYLTRWSKSSDGQVCRCPTFFQSWFRTKGREKRFSNVPESSCRVQISRTEGRSPQPTPIPIRFTSLPHQSPLRRCAVCVNGRRLVLEDLLLRDAESGQRQVVILGTGMYTVNPVDKPAASCIPLPAHIMLPVTDWVSCPPSPRAS
jgi:type VI secretion system protein ImpA